MAILITCVDVSERNDYRGRYPDRLIYRHSGAVYWGRFWGRLAGIAAGMVYRIRVQGSAVWGRYSRPYTLDRDRGR